MSHSASRNTAIIAALSFAETEMRPAADIRQHLALLAEERALAFECGLAYDVAYMADLDDEIEQTTAAYVGQAVTELACLRAAIDGPLRG